MKVSIFRRILYCTLCAGIFFAISAQAINIKGKVTDGSGPIKGAAVHLLKADKIEFTNASGEFNITDNSPSVAQTSTHLSREPFLLPPVFKRSGAAMYMDKVYDIKGVLKGSVPHPLSSNTEGLNTENGLFRSPGIFITKTQSGGKTHFAKLTAIGDPAVGRVLPGSNSGNSAQGLQKSAAPDELVISALGKTQQRMNISDLEKDVGTIKLSGKGESKYHGFTSLNFSHEGKEAHIVIPDKPHPAKPWIWRAIFWDDSPELDLRLVAKGYYLVYVHVKNMHGNDASMKIGKSFSDMLINYLGFWHKGVVSGWSRGGFFIFRFASQNTKNVSVVFADAATCNWRAWPKKPIWGMSRKEAEEWKENPSDSAIVAPMVKGGVAVIHEIWEKDGTVLPEWTYKMQELYQDMGGVYEIPVRTKGSHVSHGTKLEEIEPFILKHNPVTPPIE